MKYLPNVLSISRIMLVPLFPFFYYSDISHGNLIALFIYVLAGLTDILDGFIARKFDLITRIGIVLDPFADKLMLLSVLFTLTFAEILPWFIVILVTIKESFMIGNSNAVIGPTPYTLVETTVSLQLLKELTTTNKNKLVKICILFC